MTNQRIPEKIRELSRSRAPEFHKLLKLQSPISFEIGQIWSTKSHLALDATHSFETNFPRIVVILDTSETELVAAPISLEMQMASEYDFIVRGENSSLGFDFLVEIWNEVPVLTDHLNFYLGSLRNTIVEMLQILHEAYLLDGEVPNSLNAHRGAVLLSDDARFDFQNSEIMAVRYLAEAATYALTQTAIVEAPIKRKLLNFGLPKLQSLSRFLSPQEPNIAFAAGSDDKTTHEGYLVSQGETDSTVFEIVVSKRRYIYLMVHRVSQNIQNRQVIISIDVGEKIITSAKFELIAGDRIDLGEFKGFKPEEMTKSFKLEVLDE